MLSQSQISPPGLQVSSLVLQLLFTGQGKADNWDSCLDDCLALSFSTSAHPLTSGRDLDAGNSAGSRKCVIMSNAVQRQPGPRPILSWQT